MVPATLSESDSCRLAVSIEFSSSWFQFQLRTSIYSYTFKTIWFEHQTQNQMVPVQISDIPAPLWGPGDSKTAQDQWFRSQNQDVLASHSWPDRITLTTKTRWFQSPIEDCIVSASNYGPHGSWFLPNQYQIVIVPHSDPNGSSFTLKQDHILSPPLSFYLQPLYCTISNLFRVFHDIQPLSDK